MNPTAEFSTRASLAAFQCLESDYRSGWARLVVRRVVCADRRPEELRIHVQRRKMTSRVLVVIFYFLRVSVVKEGCTVLHFFYICYILSRKKNKVSGNDGEILRRLLGVP